MSFRKRAVQYSQQGNPMYKERGTKKSKAKKIMIIGLPTAAANQTAYAQLISPTTYPLTIGGLRWNLALQVTGTVNWAIVVMRGNVNPGNSLITPPSIVAGSGQFVNGIDTRDVMVFGTTLRGNADESPQQEGSSKTMRKLNIGDTVSIVMSCNNHPNTLVGSVQFFTMV